MTITLRVDWVKIVLMLCCPPSVCWLGHDVSWLMKYAALSADIVAEEAIDMVSYVRLPLCHRENVYSCS
jgi:hypothetical protein